MTPARPRGPLPPPLASAGQSRERARTEMTATGKDSLGTRDTLSVGTQTYAY